MVELCVVFFLSGVAIPGEEIKNGGWSCRPQPSVAKCIERRDYAQLRPMKSNAKFKWYCRPRSMKDFS